jgi:DNA-binding NtrC family response regulator
MAQETILVVDDDEQNQKAYHLMLSANGYRVLAAGDGLQALEKLERAASAVDLVLTDLCMPRLDGMGLLQALRERNYPGHVICMSGFATIESAVEATKQGAYGYLVKPVKTDALLHLVNRALDEQRLQRENESLRRELTHSYQRTDLIGTSPCMHDLFRIIEEAANTDSTVLLEGESGTGKEMVARAIHALSGRKSRPFVPVNCGGVAETLLESELFGHLKGAFTGAVRKTQGLFQAADGGTLLLDEISETTMSMQVKLLRVLQERTVRPLGATEESPIDVRFIAATNRTLSECVQAKQFREDLFYRLNVIAVRVPALRERRDDIPILAKHFLQRYVALSKKPIVDIAPEAIAQMMTYQWPGNVRELKHAIERAVALSRDPIIGLDDLPPQVSGMVEDVPPPTKLLPLAEVERNYIVAALLAADWNQTQAARTLEISRVTLWRKIRDLKIQPPSLQPLERAGLPANGQTSRDKRGAASA